MSCGVIGQLGSFMRACNNSVTTECTLLVLFDDMNQHKVEVFSEGNKNLTIYPSQFWHYLVTSKLRWIICQTSEYMNLTAQWGAPQLEGTRSNPRFLVFELHTFNQPPYRWPIRFLSSSHPQRVPGAHVWIYQWFDQFLSFSCFRSNNCQFFGMGAHWHSKIN